MIDRKALLADLRRRLKRLEQDLAERAEDVPEMTSILQEEYRGARDAERTGDTFLIWRAGALSQAAVAWLLGCVFVRFAEDNGLVDAALIAGPGERNARAEDRQTLYFRARPTDSDRDYLLDVFAKVARLPGIGRLYDRAHNPVWRHGISGDAARDLLAFWRAVDPDSGALRHDFTDSDWDTRFLGRPVSGPLRRGQEALCPVANTGVRRGVHPGPHPHSRPGRIWPPRHPSHRPRLRFRALPAGRL